MEADSGQIAPVGAVKPGDVVLERLRAELLDGLRPAGMRLNEVHLSRELGVSRTPVRAALQTLAGEGLLDYQPNRGFTVRSFPISEIIDAYEMRALAEGLAARLAAERGLSDADAAALAQALALGDAALDASLDPGRSRIIYAQANDMFHRTIHAAAGSRIVADVVRLCQRLPQAAAGNIMAFGLEDVRQRHAAHHAIADALLSRAPRDAERLMVQHVAGVKASILRAVKRRLAAA